MKKTMTVTLYVGGSLVKKITADQLDTMAYILSDVMSRYYALYPMTELYYFEDNA